MSLKSGKRKLLVDGSRRSNNKDADRGRRSVEKSGGDRGRSLERGTEGGGSGSSSRPSVFSRLGTKIQGQVPAQPPARLSGEGILFFSVLRIRIHIFLGVPDPYPDPLVSGMDPDPSIIMQI